MQSSEDRFLDGRVIAHQPLTGFRSGTDAVLLAAAVPATEDEDLLELGSGAGIASLCLAARVPGCRIYGLELVPELVDLARANARANRMEARVRFEHADALRLPKAWRRGFRHVFCNPPFHQDEGNVSPSAERAQALQDGGRLREWLATALKRVVAGGTLSVIVRADRLGEILAMLPLRGTAIFPLWPRAGEAAKRAIVQTRKNSRAAPMLLGGLVLHRENGCYTEEAEAVLRHAGSLALASPHR